MLPAYEATSLPVLSSIRRLKLSDGGSAVGGFVYPAIVKLSVYPGDRRLLDAAVKLRVTLTPLPDNMQLTESRFDDVAVHVIDPVGFRTVVWGVIVMKSLSIRKVLVITLENV